MFSILNAAWYVGTAVLYAVGAITLVALYHFVPIVYRSSTSPLRNLQGPPSSSLVFGHFKAIGKAENSVLQEEWEQKYGSTLAYRELFSTPRLWTTDTRALNHMLTHSMDFQKPTSTQYHLRRVVGPGVLVAEAEQHRNQRRTLNPAFGPAQIREFTDIFVEKSIELRDRWSNEIVNAGGKSAEVDVLAWLGRATLDIIGLAGFNYEFESMNPDGRVNELNQAFHTMFSSPQTAAQRMFMFMQGMFPPLRIISSARDRRAAVAQAVMRRIGLQLIADKKAAILAETRGAGHGVEKKDVSGRDLLTLLIKANMAVDVPENQRLTDEEVLAQVPTFIVAGHETTSTGTMWTLFSLAQHPEIQRKLRDGLLQVSTDSPTMDELNALPYLDMVVKEALRHHSPVPMTSRTAVRDCIVPVGTPYTDRHGNVCDNIHVGKGDVVSIPILATNRKKELWGEDAHEFKPERWLHPPEAISTIPGVWGNQLSFLGGPRSCIGYRFSLVETKALLFTLLRAFEFELAVKPEMIAKKSTIVQRPVVNGKTQMPLIIRRVRG